MVRPAWFLSAVCPEVQSWSVRTLATVICIEYPSLPHTFLPFQFWVRVVNNTSTHTKDTVLRIVHFYGAYGHVQRTITVRRQPADAAAINAARSEEHTSELQSLMRNSYAVF